MAKETSFYIMPYIRIYSLEENQKACALITERVEAAFQANLTEEQKYAIVQKIVKTCLFDNVFEID